MALLNCAAIHDCIKSGWEGKSSKYMCIQMRLQIKEEIKWNKNAFGVQSLMLAFPGFRSLFRKKLLRVINVMNVMIIFSEMFIQ